MFFLDELTKDNLQYVAIHGPLCEQDVVRANEIEKLLKSVPEGEVKPGDVVEVIELAANGKTYNYPNARVDAIRNGKAHVCLNVHQDRPHINKKGSLETSGGTWLAIPIEELKHQGKKEALLWTWGHNGHYKSGGGLNIKFDFNYFKAEINNYANAI